VVRREREHCCDELAARALGNRAEYGRALLALEELRGTTPAFAVGAKTGSLLERIRRLAQLEPTPRITTGGVAGIILVCAIVVTAGIWTASSTDAHVPKGNSPSVRSDAVKVAEEDVVAGPETVAHKWRIEVLAIGNEGETPQRWWDVQGNLLNSVSF